MEIKKSLIMYGAAIISVLAVAINLIEIKAPFSDLELANIEALTNNEDGIPSGDPCYNVGKYDIDYPEVVICGKPCYRQKTNLPIFPTRSYCE